MSARAATVLDFEGSPDSTILTNQYPGVTFTNAIILTAGVSLNEFEFPPLSGVNVASDNGGPMSITFATPVMSFAGYFTYLEPLTMSAFDAADDQVASASSLFSDNLACLAGPPCSGDPGSSPNELIQVSFTGGVSSVTITGDPAGGSFTLDDATYTTAPVAIPEATNAFQISVGLGVLAIRKRHSIPMKRLFIASAAVAVVFIAGGVWLLAASEIATPNAFTPPAQNVKDQIQNHAAFHVYFPTHVPLDYSISTNLNVAYSDGVVIYTITASSGVPVITVEEGPAGHDGSLFLLTDHMDQSGSAISMKIDGQPGYSDIVRQGLKADHELTVVSFMIHGVIVQLSSFNVVDTQILLGFANTME
jgi:hypothetical protein